MAVAFPSHHKRGGSRATGSVAVSGPDRLVSELVADDVLLQQIAKLIWQQNTRSEIADGSPCQRFSHFRKPN